MEGLYGRDSMFFISIASMAISIPLAAAVPGIGRITARFLASIGFGTPCPSCTNSSSAGPVSLLPKGRGCAGAEESQPEKVVIEMDHKLHIPDLPSQVSGAKHIACRGNTGWRRVESCPGSLNRGNNTANKQHAKRRDDHQNVSSHIDLLSDTTSSLRADPQKFPSLEASGKQLIWQSGERACQADILAEKPAMS